MSDMDDDEYGDIADEDLIEAFSQPSQALPARPGKRARNDYSGEEDDDEIDELPKRTRRISRSSGSGSEIPDDEAEEDAQISKRKKYKIHVADKEVPKAQILGATQVDALDALPDSSPYRIRGPIYRKPRPEPSHSPGPPSNFRPRSGPAPQSNSVQRRPASPEVIDDDDEFGLSELSPNALSFLEGSAAPNEPVVIGSSPLQQVQRGALPSQRLVAPQFGLRQTTLFGGQAPLQVPASQVNKKHSFKVDKPPEEPTHHALDQEALKTWVYPTNLGNIRDYQFSIVRNGLFNNLLVALPTGLGKTCIAATIMLNFFRWTKDAKIVFVAPTKPLVSQQVDACFNIVGIPKSQTTMLTGDQVPALRAEEWEDKRVFFMTPQTLDNDLASGIADPKKIVLLVVDEAHRATGNYAYVKVVKFLRRFNKSFRVLALTATPGASVEAVQEVIDNLEISKVEIRTEESIDIQQYVHQRNIDQILLDPSDEIVLIKEHFSKALQPLVNQLCGLNAFYNKDPMALTPFGLMQARKKWFMSNAGKTASMGVKGMANALFQILASVSHSIKLLNFHGISPFYATVKEFRQSVEAAGKPSKYKNMIVQDPNFKKMMDRISSWVGKDDFIGHPKLTYLCDTILNHFLDAGEGRLGDDAPPSATRVIVFSEFRDSAEDIARVLNKHKPMIRATVFVGQQDSKRSEGMNQAKQLDTLKKFKSGVFNVIVATSIGEEGLDIGQVDLIVCYDASGSPIRMLQRMGRTGRKRAGKIVLLLMKGKEEESFAKAKDNYEQMQKMISSGARFAFRHDLSVRILPRDVNPTVDKRLIEIPIENTQDPSLPEPKRRPTKLKKKPPKKFHMPDGAQTGFTNASKLSGDGVVPLTKLGITVQQKGINKSDLAPKIAPNSVLLTPLEKEEFEQRYLEVDFAGDDFVEIEMLDMGSHPSDQRLLGPTIDVPHGRLTKRSVQLFKTLSHPRLLDERYSKLFGREEPSRDFWDPEPLVRDESEIVQKPPARKAVHQPKKTVSVPDLAPAPAPAVKKTEQKQQTQNRARARAILEMMSEGSEAEESIHASSDYPRSRNRGDSLSGDESEGEGDDVRSEAWSEDSDGDIGSLKDFLASGGLSSQLEMVKSSASGPSREYAGRKGKRFRLDEDIDEDEGELNVSRSERPIVIDDEENENEDEEIRDDEDNIEAPVRRHKEKRRRVLDSDSDE